jgi:hypothetical protein
MKNALSGHIPRLSDDKEPANVAEIIQNVSQVLSSKNVSKHESAPFLARLGKLKNFFPDLYSVVVSQSEWEGAYLRFRETTTIHATAPDRPRVRDAQEYHDSICRVLEAQLKNLVLPGLQRQLEVQVTELRRMMYDNAQYHAQAGERRRERIRRFAESGAAIGTHFGERSEPNGRAILRSCHETVARVKDIV